MKRVRRWCGRFDAAELEFFLLALPAAPWRELADVCHARPDDFALPWFLPVVMGGDAPAGSVVAAAAALGGDAKRLAAALLRPYTIGTTEVGDAARG